MCELPEYRLIQTMNALNCYYLSQSSEGIKQLKKIQNDEKAKEVLKEEKEKVKSGGKSLEDELFFANLKSFSLAKNVKK